MEALESSFLLLKTKSRIELTPHGREIASMLKQDSEPEVLQQIAEFKELLNDLTYDELLAFVYFSHPSLEEIIGESSWYEEFLPIRERLAISLYEKDKVSAQKAAQIAGEYLGDFLKKIKSKL